MGRIDDLAITLAETEWKPIRRIPISPSRAIWKIGYVSEGLEFSQDRTRTLLVDHPAKWDGKYKWDGTALWA